MCAGTVVEPPGPTSAAMVSVISRSRSVALKASLDLSALISTLARIGMVLRRSTTRWTWPSDFSSAARSTVTFMLQPAWLAWKRPEGVGKVACMRGFRKGDGGGRTYLPNEEFRLGAGGGNGNRPLPLRGKRLQPFCLHARPGSRQGERLTPAIGV